MYPSFFALGFSGIVLAIALILFAMNADKMKIGKIVEIIVLISLAIGIHGILHFLYETRYQFNPLKGKWSLTEVA
uniref:Uncharacterized protein n=1 Tax=viral metagenome TaxID=1070528 RepID=A0A6C0CQC0_9ZZZZ